VALNFLKWPLSDMGGVLVTVTFCAFTLVSIALYPTPFSPLNNWLSDLGNPKLDPAGSIFFNAGCILTGLAMIVLMAGLGQWGVRGWKKIALAAGQACGVLSAFALMMIGVFTEGTPLHGTMSIVFFSLLFLFLVLTNMAISYDSRYLRWIGYYALLAIAIDLVFIYTYFAYAHNTIWEWLAVFGALLWVAMVSYNLFMIDRRTESPVLAADI
jgi:hypothetical membrane protein